MQDLILQLFRLPVAHLYLLEKIYIASPVPPDCIMPPAVPLAYAYMKLTIGGLNYYLTNFASGRERQTT